jgi:hypothetical protein
MIIHDQFEFILVSRSGENYSTTLVKKSYKCCHHCATHHIKLQTQTGNNHGAPIKVHLAGMFLI